MSVYRVCLSLVVFHLAFMVFCLFVSTSNSWRAAVHNGSVSVYHMFSEIQNASLQWIYGILFQLLVVESRCYCWTLCTEFSNNIGRTSRHLYVKRSLLKSANITSYTPLLFPRFRPHVCGNGWRVFVHPPQTVHARRLRSFLEQQMVDTITICMN